MRDLIKLLAVGVAVLFLAVGQARENLNDTTNNGTFSGDVATSK